MVQFTNSSKVILFLDDSAERAAKLVCEHMKIEDQNRTIWCKTAEEAIITIRDYYDRIDLMFLDHDLGIEGQNFGSQDSGMEVVRYLQNNVLYTKEMKHAGCKIIVHSWNLAAAKIMVERLRDLGFSVRSQPFAT